MNIRSLPLDPGELNDITTRYETPFHLYDEKGIRETCRAFAEGFSWVQYPDGSPGGFKNFYAVKALPNPAHIKTVHEEGIGFDCSSGPELVMAQRIGVTGEDLILTSNDTPAYEFRKASELGAIINLDDISHIDYLEQHVGLPELICVRYNPGNLKGGNAIIGKPEEAKYGFTRAQVIEGLKTLKARGVKRFALHTMVASNELDPEYFVETAAILFDLAKEIYETLGISLEFLNLGGGIGIPYKPEQQAVDLRDLGARIHALYQKEIEGTELHPLRIVMENGRCVTGPHGYLVSHVRHVKDTYKRYIGLDAAMQNLMRPGMYDAYHHITVPAPSEAGTDVVDVTGSLCENNDKFAINRELPRLTQGDLVVIHDTGAHGHSMGFNYNGKLRSAELLLQTDGSVRLIRRAETENDYFATLDVLDVMK